MRLRVLAILAAACAAASLVAPSSALAHAVLKRTEPARGTTVDAQPERVAFYFSEPVEAAFGAVRVFDAEGQRVDDERIQRPSGSKSIGVGLREGLPDGSYTATYRVVSADSHPVSGGFVFSIGAPGAAPSQTVAELSGAAGAGPATQVAFGVARGLEYAAIAVVVGALAWMVAVWLPALGAVADGRSAWIDASRAGYARLRTLLIAALVVGTLACAAGIVLQGATAGGTSFWSALDPEVIGDVLDTRFGGIWGLRLLDWILIAAMLGVLARAREAPGLRPASLGAAGVALRRPREAALAALALPLGFLVVSPALAGHASTQSPEALLLPANALHVLSMCVWAGGLACLVLVLPGATRKLPADQRAPLLAATLQRFSPLALAAVALLVVTGTVQAIVYLGALDDLFDTAFGRAVLIKIGLAALLVALGAWTRRRGIPAVRSAADSGSSLGAAGRRVRDSLRTEVALIVAALAVTAALVAYSPPASSAASGPYASEQTVGPIQFQVTVDPAQVGRNVVHVYLLSTDSGAPYQAVTELRATARLKDPQIGPLSLKARLAGPGHYIVDDATLGVRGKWQLDLAARVSDFDEYTAKFEVPVR